MNPPPAARRKLCSIVDTEPTPNGTTSNVISLEDVRARREQQDLRRAILERAPYLAEWVSAARRLR